MVNKLLDFATIISAGFSVYIVWVSLTDFIYSFVITEQEFQLWNIIIGKRARIYIYIKIPHIYFK